MELAYGLRHTSSDYLVEVMGGKGIELRDIGSLVRSGLPADARCKASYSGNFGDFRLRDARECLSALGMHFPQNVEIRHQFFACHSNGVEVVLPALALLRAIFRPTRYFLPRLFYPNALGRVSQVNFDQFPPTVVLTSAIWQDPARYGDLIGPLEWLNLYPSAKSFASSVYTYALNGWIGCDLPMAEAELSVRGVRRGTQFFATNVTILSLTAAESPYAFAGPRDPAVFRRAIFRTLGKSAERRDLRVLKHSDGSVDLSDEEWRAIEPLLEDGRGRVASRCHERRLIMDGLLRKLGVGTGWKSTEYPTGGLTHALHAYRVWSRNGALDRALDLLSRLRRSAMSSD